MTSNSRQTLLAINSTEWLNLCACGSIRMSKRRPVLVANPAADQEMEKVFWAAPYTKLNSSVDLFVLVLQDAWVADAVRHRSNSSEVLTLTIADVISHHPVAEEHFDYYANIGSKCGVRLDSAIFEKSWLFWITNETLKSSLNAADRLQKSFGFQTSARAKRQDKYKWEDLARLVLRPNEPIKVKPAHIETLISNIRRIADAVSSTRDSEQFYIACVIEWINLRLGKDPMTKKSCRQILESALAQSKELPLGSPSIQTTDALRHLVEIYPKAFTDELTPIMISHVVQLLTESRTRKLKPETAVRIIHSLERESAASKLLIFLLATSLGIELTNQLVLATSKLDFADMNWELAN